MFSLLVFYTETEAMESRIQEWKDETRASTSGVPKAQPTPHDTKPTTFPPKYVPEPESPWQVPVQ